MRGSRPREREREKNVLRQPPIGGKDDDDGEIFWISKGLPNSSKRRRRWGGRGWGRGGTEKVDASEVDVGADGDKIEIKVKKRRGHE